MSIQHQTDAEARAQFAAYMKRKVPAVIYQSEQGTFVVAPAEFPSWWLSSFSRIDAARVFCQQSSLEFTEHDTCPVAAAGKPIKIDMVFSDAPGLLGASWAQVCEIENQLAEKLHPLPLGTVVVLKSDVWFLKDEGEHLVLCHGNYANQKVSDVSSRFDFGLDWVDVENDDLDDYVEIVRQGIETFQTSILAEVI